MDTNEELRAGWDALAEDWIARMENPGDPYRVGLLDAWMLDAVGDVAGLDVIDLGCGEGRFGRMLAERGAVVTGVDACARFIEYANAQRSSGERYIVGDMQDLAAIEPERFDLAVSYVTLCDVPDHRRAIAEAARVLRPGGRFVACNLQPMNTAGNGWIKCGKDKLHFKLDNYFDEGPRDMPLCGHPQTNFHRTLSNYVDAFLDAGFAIEGLREPKPFPEQLARYPEVSDNLRVPYFMIWLLRKAA